MSSMKDIRFIRYISLRFFLYPFAISGRLADKPDTPNVLLP